MPLFVARVNVPIPVLDCPASSISNRPFHHLFRIVARRSISSDERTARFQFEGWWLVLRRKGTRVCLTTLIRAAVGVFAANLAKSTSTVRNVDHRGSREVGWGIVMPVSAVAWDELSEAVVVVSRDEEVWDEFRGLEAAKSLREASFLEEMLTGLAVAAVVVIGEAAAPCVFVVLLLLSLVVAALAADGAVLSESDDRELLTGEDERETEDALLEKTLWGRCLIFVKYKVARFSARLRVLPCDSVDWRESGSRSLGVELEDRVLDPEVGDPALSLGFSFNDDRLPVLARLAPDSFSALLGGDGDREEEIHEGRLANSANASTVLGFSRCFWVGTSWDTSMSLYLDTSFGGWPKLPSTSGLDFELGSQERGRSIIDLVRLGVSASATRVTVDGIVVSVLISTTSSFGNE